MSAREAAPPEPPPLATEDLRRLAGFLHERTGMAYGESRRTYIERRLTERMQRCAMPSFAGYMALLRSSAAEVEALVNSFTVNETYFYREEAQLACLSRSLLPEIVRRRGPGDLVRIWSVPCSTGDEPYSIAIWLLENWPLVDAYNIEIIGSDIDTRALADAVAGWFGARALGRLPAALVARYFEPAEAGRWRIIQDLRESVRFTRTNLVDQASMAAQGRFDVVFCRNVLIYFDQPTKARVLNAIAKQMTPDGLLYLGGAETVLGITDRFAAVPGERGVYALAPANQAVRQAVSA